MEPKPVRPPKTKLLQSSVQKAHVVLDGPYESLKPGNWYTHDISGVRTQMHSAGVIPKLVLDHKGCENRRLVAKCEGGDCVVSQVDKDSMEAIRTFLEHFHVTYAGQSLPAATQIVLFKLLEPRRQHLTEKERANLLASQNG